MNLLAHLHVGDRLSPVAAAGNLAADFCRKSDCPEYRKGIELHKKIDAFTDSHPVVLEARKLFPGKLRRFAPVILDLVFDHCLSQSWKKWQSTIPRGEFIESRLTEILQCTPQLPSQASMMIRSMHQTKLLHRYSELAGVEFSMRRIVARRPKFEPMLQAIALLESHYPLIDQTFQIFYPELLAHTIENPSDIALKT
ncbi:Acyl carrier protein phosphodiesterase [[Leptolyngbya] sp. PCC 7376]|uniref:acyl carrier protein phosphodiesterase n=1 Tax=[Leptolyngbya] sp. PCC 7376 TaxID=111781 RepID=UPI00029F0943|nr:ACP phosphodiesterase [[Leptolyngbya] sp. PCC 7376]AFY38198.1 Acyl carrier protein phosphodiesterase [[Leptolyngbya] sp. PCC 7376]